MFKKIYDETLVVLFGTFTLYEIVIIDLHNDYSNVDFRHGGFFFLNEKTIGHMLIGCLFGMICDTRKHDHLF